MVSPHLCWPFAWLTGHLSLPSLWTSVVASGQPQLFPPLAPLSLSDAEGCNWCVRTPGGHFTSPLLLLNRIFLRAAYALRLPTSFPAQQQETKAAFPAGLCGRGRVWHTVMRPDSWPMSCYKVPPTFEKKSDCPVPVAPDLRPRKILLHQHKDFYFQVKLNCQHTSGTEIRDRTAFLCTGIAVSRAVSSVMFNIGSSPHQKGPCPGI